MAVPLSPSPEEATLRGGENKQQQQQQPQNDDSSQMRPNGVVDHLEVNPLALYSAQLAQKQKQLHIRRVSESADEPDGEDGRAAHYFGRVKSLFTSNGSNGNGCSNSLELEMGNNGDMDMDIDDEETNKSQKHRQQTATAALVNGAVAEPELDLDQDTATASSSAGSSSGQVPTLSTSRTRTGEHTPNSSPEAGAGAGQRTAGTATSTSNGQQQEAQQQQQQPSQLAQTAGDAEQAQVAGSGSQEGEGTRLSDSSSSAAAAIAIPATATAGPNPSMYLVGSALSTSSTSVLPAGATRSPRLATQSFSSGASANSSGGGGGSPRKRERPLPNLASLHTASTSAIPLANVIPPTPPSAGTSPTTAAAFDAKAAYLSPEQLRKSPPGHRRSQSYTNSVSAVASTSASASTFAGINASTGTTLSPGSYPPRRSSLLANVSTASAEEAAKRRALSPRRGLSFRNSISLRQNPVVVDEPLTLEQQEEQQRATDVLNEDIARQAEQIRKERANKRIETQRAHEKAIAALRDREVSPVQGQGPGSPLAGEFNLPQPPVTPGLRKGKERERGDSFNFQPQQQQQAPSSPTSTSQLWAAASPAGEKAQLRIPPEVGAGILPDAVAAKATSPTSREPPPEAQAQAQAQAQQERVLVGNLIGEDHVNYVLMYNMLTGIRIGVSRCEAKPRRPLTDEDYSARHKFSFDIVGNELTPSARYDFKFKDYAPWVFRELREYFRLDPADYLLSLTAKYILSELGSPGKSGSFFYFSRDYRFIIKTISHTEHKFLRRILKDYYKHVMDNPHTLISRFYGLHRVKLPRGRKIHFVIMNNLFPPHRDIHETYDLKGSSIGRIYPEEKAAENPRGILKDLNWLHRHRELAFGPTKRQLFEEQLKRDVELLQRMGIMDYSLLVGVHDGFRGNSENLRDGMLTVFQPEGMGGKLRRRPTHRGELEVANAHALRRAVQQSDPKALGEEGHKLPQYKDRSERKMFLFYQDEGGIRATDENDTPQGTIYYLGIIDILTPYNCKKKIEHAWRSMQYDAHRISAVPPQEYGQRFLDFLFSVIHGGDVTRRPKME